MAIFKQGTLIPVTGSGSVAPIAPSSGGPIYGVDVYHDDDVTSWSEMLNAGYVFAFIKASQGMSEDPLFAKYFNAAKAAGLIVGAYHFYSTASSQVDQANFFASLLASVGYAKTDLPPVFDFENASGNYGSSDAANAKAFLGAIQSATGRLPLLYCSNSVPGELGNPSWIKAYPLWTAEYGVSAPRVSGWTIWQQSGTASIPGLGNTGDKNIFMGSKADLQNWISQT